MKRTPIAVKENPVKHTTIRLPEALLKRAKIKAIEEGTTFTALLIEALEARVKQSRK
jgi:predicted DNA binding CopG/RHH family protein